MVAGIAAVFILCLCQTGLKFLHLHEGSDPWGSFVRFFGAAFSPTLTDQSTTLPDGVTPFFQRALTDLLRTIRYALVAMSLAVPLGLFLGFLTSTAWWPADDGVGTRRRSRKILAAMRKGLRWCARGVIALMRSVHELIWAMLFLSMVGDAPVTACVALALPFAGTLGKVFSELIEEQSKSARQTLLYIGTSPLKAFLIGLLPVALPNLLTYTAYRFECALRSSAVLGFIGLETIGLTIRRSFENLYFREVWTSLYLLILTILIVDRFSAWLRYRLQRVPSGTPPGAPTDEAMLRRQAPRDRWLRGWFTAIPLMVFAAWLVGQPLAEGLADTNRSERMARFITKLTPEPARPDNALAGWGERVSLIQDNAGEVLSWVGAMWKDPGREALTNTLVIATAAIILAGALAGALLPWGSRVLATSEPFALLGSISRVRKRLWTALGFCVRGGFVLARAIPEYILAFLLVGLLGPSAWPLIIALAIHNAGVLGRLWGEIVENHPPGCPRQTMLSGASRSQTYLMTILPGCFNRFLLFFFYRWETCLREATILGMLGISSLGYYISISRNFLAYDRMIFFVMLGAIVIFAGDLFSDWLRRRLRD